MQAPTYQDLSAPAPDLLTAPDPFADTNSKLAPTIPQQPAPSVPASAPIPAPAAAFEYNTATSEMSTFASVTTVSGSQMASPTATGAPQQNFFTAVNAQIPSAYVPGGSLVSGGTAVDGEGFPVAEPLPADATTFQKAAYYVGSLRSYKDRKMAHLRPWRDFFAKDEFSVPGKLEALSRISDNLNYFNSNYIALVALMSIYILITNVSFMIGMAVVALMYYYVRMKQAANENIFLHTYELTPTQAFAGLGVGGFLTFYLTGGSSTVFWLVTCAAVIVLGHAVTRRPMQRLAEPANTQVSFA